MDEGSHKTVVPRATVLSEDVRKSDVDDHAPCLFKTAKECCGLFLSRPVCRAVARLDGVGVHHPHGSRGGAHGIHDIVRQAEVACFDVWVIPAIDTGNVNDRVSLRHQGAKVAPRLARGNHDIVLSLSVQPEPRVPPEKSGCTGEQDLHERASACAKSVWISGRPRSMSAVSSMLSCFVEVES